mmetsp:Transcript_46174/g.100795  ORF Transcript_46174/g.100795 Transcript_46174/m.100795 type:complete len:216 (-) Transcript_46174:766-1413(-)
MACDRCMLPTGAGPDMLSCCIAAALFWLGRGSGVGLAASGFGCGLGRIGCGLARIGSRFNALIEDAKAEDGAPMPPAGGHLGSCETGPVVFLEAPVSPLGTSFLVLSATGGAPVAAGAAAGLAASGAAGASAGAVDEEGSSVFGRSIFLLAMPFFFGAEAGSAAGAVCCCGGGCCCCCCCCGGGGGWGPGPAGPPENCCCGGPRQPWPWGGCGGG